MIRELKYCIWNIFKNFLYVWCFVLLICSRRPLIFQYRALQVRLHLFKARHHRQQVSPRLPCPVFDQCILQVHQLHSLLLPFLHIPLVVLMNPLLRALRLFRRIQLAVVIGLLSLQTLLHLLYSRAVFQLQLEWPPRVSNIPLRCLRSPHRSSRQQAASTMQQ